MCRHLAWIGTPRTLASLVLEPEYCLARQSWAPREMRGSATINADGFGVGWYREPGLEARRLRSDRPLWADESFADVATSVSSTGVLAALRSATVGMPVVRTGNAPFAEGRWLFSHNGVVAGWPHTLDELASRLPVTDLLTLEAPVDSAALWLLVRHGLRQGQPAGEVLAGVCREVAAAAPGSRLNLLLHDGQQVVATTLGHSLWVHRSDDGVLVASERSDDGPGWQAVPEGQLLLATAGEASWEPLVEPASTGRVRSTRRDLESA